MKYFRSLIIVYALFVGGCFIGYIAHGEKTQPTTYTVRIINGNSLINYEATIQVDSFTIFSQKSAFVYANGNFLKINADFIIITKN